MSTIGFDVGRLPSVLAALQNPAIAQRVANAAAESYNDDIHNWIHAGRGFTPRTGGGLEQHINWRPLGNGAAEVYANKDYAGYVEHGTRAHVIRPRNARALRFPVLGGGGFGFARSINHPGSRPHPYFFANADARSQRMQAKARLVIAQAIADG